MSLLHSTACDLPPRFASSICVSAISILRGARAAMGCGLPALLRGAYCCSRSALRALRTVLSCGTGELLLPKARQTLLVLVQGAVDDKTPAPAPGSCSYTCGLRSTDSEFVNQPGAESRSRDSDEFLPTRQQPWTYGLISCIRPLAPP